MVHCLLWITGSQLTRDYLVKLRLNSHFPQQNSIEFCRNSHFPLSSMDHFQFGLMEYFKTHYIWYFCRINKKDSKSCMSLTLSKVNLFVFLTLLPASHNASHASTEHWSRQINTSKIYKPSPNAESQRDP